MEVGKKRLAGDARTPGHEQRGEGVVFGSARSSAWSSNPPAGPADSGQAGHSEDNLQSFGLPGLEDRTSGPGRIWNRIPDSVRQEIVELALQEPELSPRELAVRFTDTKRYFVSETSVYRILKAHDLITSPAFVVIKAADAFRDKTTAPNQLW